jgi:ABC-type antimicrobial peptide transport system permease subunit
MDTLLKDLRFGARSLLRQRAFTSVVVITLALGIGANTTIFSVINALILMFISFWLTRLIVKLLFAVQPTDLLTFGVATLVLLFAALLASYLPARTATKVDPIVALRFE